MTETKARVVFLPNGGFEKTGAFVELGEDADISDSIPQYQRQAFLRVTLKCVDLQLQHSWSVTQRPGPKHEGPEREPADQTDQPPETRRSIGGTGFVERSRFGRYRFSLLGEDSEHDQVSIRISDGGVEERAYFAGMEDIDEFDVKAGELFFLEIHLPTERFDALVGAISQQRAQLWADMSVSAFRGFYATWSPSIDEGRVIKFLNRSDDVENADEMPAAFHQDASEEDGSFSWRDDVVRLYVTRALSEPSKSQAGPHSVEPLEARDEEQGEGERLDGHTEASVVPQLNSQMAALCAAQTTLSRRVIFAALIVAAAILAVGY